MKEIKRLADAATPGPWTTHEDDCGRASVTLRPRAKGGRSYICSMLQPYPDGESDAEFIAACRTAVPELVEEVKALRALVRDILDSAMAFNQRDFDAYVARARELGVTPEGE